MDEVPRFKPRWGHTDKSAHRKNAYDFYHSKAWKQMRLFILRREPLCRTCFNSDPKRIVLATIVDHIVPRNVDMSRELDPENLQPQCHSCHNAKTALDKQHYRI
jgi:5-methylcytosine-specific restriction protein A